MADREQSPPLAMLNVISPEKHAEFRIDYVWVATAAALLLGFAVGAHVAAVVGFDFPLGPGFYSFIQVHGHVQLIGFAGLLIVGISLHFIPRLAGVPLAKPWWLDRILWLIAAGLLLRSLAQCTVPYLEGRPAFTVVNWLNPFSGLLELGGIVLYVLLLARTARGAMRGQERPALTQVLPFFAMMLAGFVLYASLNCVLLFQMALQGAIVVDQPWNEFAVQLFVGLVLLPVAFAFSVRMFPLYLRLPAVTWPVAAVAGVYLAGVTLQLASILPVLASVESFVLRAAAQAGAILKGGAVLWLVWKLDVLTRCREPWTINRVGTPADDRRPTRPALPDYGEFGRFERLVYAAYVWLVIGAAFEVIAVFCALFGHPPVHSTDALRHIYLIGFITHLIFGMAVRMIPGFMHKRAVASPRLVGATFWLASFAAAFRVIPLLLPVSLIAAVPTLAFWMQAAFGVSGVIAMLAILCLIINLWRTI